ncbi:hypothetical protein QZH41_009578 [Actinostola sp. cb2023]|nr:hypothetical protein QZH41_009578 [Actinostola sp. cb2023]
MSTTNILLIIQHRVSYLEPKASKPAMQGLENILHSRGARQSSQGGGRLPSEPRRPPSQPRPPRDRDPRNRPSDRPPSDYSTPRDNGTPSYNGTPRSDRSERRDPRPRDREPPRYKRDNEPPRHGRDNEPPRHGRDNEPPRHGRDNEPPRHGRDNEPPRHGRDYEPPSSGRDYELPRYDRDDRPRDNRGRPPSTQRNGAYRPANGRASNNDLRAWCKEKTIKTSLEEMTIGQIDANLRRFYAEARKKDGEMYGKKTLLGFRHAIERRGREGQRQLTTSSFKLEVDAAGRNFITMAHDEVSKNHPGGLKDTNSTEKNARIYETNHPNDGYRALRVYISKLNPKCTAFFQYPKKNWAPTDSSWSRDSCVM